MKNSNYNNRFYYDDLFTSARFSVSRRPEDENFFYTIKTSNENDEGLNLLFAVFLLFLLPLCCFFTKHGLQKNKINNGIEGDIGGYPIPQYRTRKWQIPKYRVENRLNTDTTYFDYTYNRFRILMVASI